MTTQAVKHNYLEGLRGLMALIVVISHFLLLFSPVTYSGSFNYADFRDSSLSFKILLVSTPLNLFMNGPWAVCVFFILSGYVLSLGYFRTNNTRLLQASAFKRYFRLAIPVLAICLIIYVLHYTGAFSKIYYPRHVREFSFGKNLFSHKIPFLNTLKIALVDVLLKSDTSLLPVLWTLRIEFIGALLLFAFLLITHDLSKKWLYYFTIILALLLSKSTYIILFFAGSFIALYQQKIRHLFRNRWFRIPVLLLALFFGGIPGIEGRVKVYTMYFFAKDFADIYNVYFQIISAILLFIWLISSQIGNKILSLKPFQFLGKVSFSLYLLHLPLLFILGSYLLNETQGKINYYLLFMICLGACLAVSHIFFKLVDLTAIRLSNKFGQLVFKDTQVIL